MTTFVPTLEEVAAHLAEVSPAFRAFVEGGQAALDAEAQAASDAAAQAPTPDAAEAAAQAGSVAQ